MVSQDAESIRIAAENYQVHIRKEGFRFGFAHPSGAVIAPAHADSGLEFGASPAAQTRLIDSKGQAVLLEVVKRTGRFGGCGNLPFGPLRAFFHQAAR